MAFQAGKEEEICPQHQRVSALFCMVILLMVTLLDCKYKSSIIYSYRDLKTEEDSEEDQSDRDVLLQLLSVPDLPPSLLPPPSGGWKVQENTEWG